MFILVDLKKLSIKYSFKNFRIHDVYNNRILQVLSSMQLISLHNFPEDGTTWTADEFLDKIEETCRQASMVCDLCGLNEKINNYQ